MPTILKIQSFSESNIRERTALKAPASAGDQSIEVKSTQGYAAGDVLFVGALSREGCEKVVVDSVTDAEHLALASALQYDHAQFDAVTSVVGDMIHIWRAANVDGSVPADELFSVLASRSIDPDQQASYYTDSSGNSNYWYRTSYYNSVSAEETDVTESTPVRGDDFGHYATLGAIRAEAGLTNATNLSDVLVDQKRREAEAEINSVLGGRYQTPFVKPIPDLITTITIKLAAGLLLNNVYSATNGTAGKARVDDARAQLAAMRDSKTDLPDDGTSTDLVGSGVSYNDNDEPRAFTMGQTF